MISMEFQTTSSVLFQGTKRDNCSLIPCFVCWNALNLNKLVIQPTEKHQKQWRRTKPTITSSEQCRQGRGLFVGFLISLRIWRIKSWIAAKRSDIVCQGRDPWTHPHNRLLGAEPIDLYHLSQRSLHFCTYKTWLHHIISSQTQLISFHFG